MNRFPPIEVSCISDGGKLCSYQLGLATNKTAEKAPQRHANDSHEVLTDIGNTTQIDSEGNI